MDVPWSQALAWRLDRHHLATDPAPGVDAVVGRVVAVQAGTGDPDLAVGARLAAQPVGAVAEALAEGRIVKTYAFRGATHLMTPSGAADHAAVRAVGRQWELPDWRSFYGIEPDDWPALREVVREALADGPRTRPEIAAAVAATPRFAHLAPAITHPSQTFLKPFAWQGDALIGPPRDGEFTLLGVDGIPGWPGLPDVEEAGPRAILAYVDGYGPTTAAHVHYWLGEGLSAGRARLTRWLADLVADGALVETTVAGRPTLIRPEQVAALEAVVPSTRVVLLPGFDPWFIGAGTSDANLVPPSRRALVSRGASTVAFGGVLSGTWKVAKEMVAITWFPEAGTPPRDALEAEVQRLAVLTGRERGLTLELA